MQPRSLEQVLASLDSVYSPQVESVRKRQSLIPQQVQAEEQGLEAKKTQAFGDILGGARRRGLGFSGIPLGEQATYTATEFLPALARLKQSGREQAMSLEDAILGIQERRNAQGQQIYQYETSLAEQRRQFNEQQKLARETARQSAAAGNSWLNALGGGNESPFGAIQRQDKGFNFTDSLGNPISAAAYAAATGTPFRQILQTMANAGDTGAKTALGFVGDDFGYDPRKVNNESLANLYNDLVWGTGRKATPFRGLSVGVANPQQRIRVR